MPAPPLASKVDSAARFQHVACYVDGSPRARRALEEARRRLAPGGRLSVVYVDATLVAPLVSVEAVMCIWDPDEQRAALEAWLCEELRDVPGAVPVVLEGHPGEELCAWARAARPELILAARDGILGRLLRGGVVRALLRGAPCPIMVVGPKPTADPPLPRLALAS